jgi:mxaK protein
MRRGLIITLLPVAFCLAAMGFTGLALRAEATNRTVRALRANQDIAVTPQASAPVLFARIVFLIEQNRLDEVQPFLEALDKKGDPRARADAHYDYANARLRLAFDDLTHDRQDAAGPSVILARREYRTALTLVPDHWDAKFNLDVASRLIRDFPAFERTMGDTVKSDPKKIWTDIPGSPRGLP